MWGQPVTVSEVADVGAAAAAVTSFAASSGSYVQLSQRSMELLRQHQMIPGQTAKFFQGAVRGAQGRLPTLGRKSGRDSCGTCSIAARSV
jgi:hypothetical protein